MSSLQCPTTLVLARPGAAEYEANAGQGEGGSLTTLGRAQARGLAERFASRRVAHVWTSTLARAVQTAEIVAGGLGVAVTTRAGLAGLDGLGGLGDLAARVPGGESDREVVTRMTGVLAEIVDQHPGETVLVVGHGAALRLAVPRWARMDVRAHRLANAAVIEVRVDPDGAVCVAWDEPA